VATLLREVAITLCAIYCIQHTTPLWSSGCRRGGRPNSSRSRELTPGQHTVRGVARATTEPNTIAPIAALLSVMVTPAHRCPMVMSITRRESRAGKFLFPPSLHISASNSSTPITHLRAHTVASSASRKGSNSRVITHTCPPQRSHQIRQGTDTATTSGGATSAVSVCNEMSWRRAALAKQYRQV
jgi:hypothetical protein